MQEKKFPPLQINKKIKEAGVFVVFVLQKHNMRLHQLYIISNCLIIQVRKIQAQVYQNRYQIPLLTVVEDR